MKVNNKHYRTIWMDGRSVMMIEQNKLPFSFEIFEATDHHQTCMAIKTMIVRGAGAIGAAAGFAMAQACLEAVDADNYLNYLDEARQRIEATRPTAYNLFHATKLVFDAGQTSPEKAVKTAQQLANENREEMRQIGVEGDALIESGMRIATHCNAGWLAFVDYGSALAPLFEAHRKGKEIFVYADETRPRNQGARLTAWELYNETVPHAIIPDNATAWMMAQGKIDMMITGADRIAANGDTANKIGTLEKAIAAKHFGIPFYIAAPLTTFDFNCKEGADIKIEERNQDEVLWMEGIDKTGQKHQVRVANPGSGAQNPAFDVTPHNLITGYITSEGIIPPNEVAIKRLSDFF